MNTCKYKLEAYRVEDHKKIQTKYGNNLEFFMTEATKPYRNYYHKVYEKAGNRWKEINF